MDVVECRYNSKHKIKRTRRFIHEGKCPDKHDNIKNTMKTINIGNDNDNEIKDLKFKEEAKINFKVLKKKIQKEKILEIENGFYDLNDDLIINDLE